MRQPLLISVTTAFWGMKIYCNFNFTVSFACSALRLTRYSPSSSTVTTCASTNSRLLSSDGSTEPLLAELGSSRRTGAVGSGHAVNFNNTVNASNGAMTKVGEETGELGKILTMLAKFYSREVSNAVDTLVGLIEPVMIVALGGGVGVLMASVLIPMYNIASQIQ